MGGFYSNPAAGFQSVIPQAPNNSNTLQHQPKRNTSSGVSTSTAANTSANISPLDLSETNSSRTPLTVGSGSLDRSISYRSRDGEASKSQQTEGQFRRDNMADCEFECSQISKYLYVGGQRVAENLGLLKEKKITRIINCAASVIPNYHEKEKEFQYLTLTLVDGGVEDISWFLCEVIHFIREGKEQGQKTLLHCQKGISRSCAFAIAYRMLSTGKEKISFVVISFFFFLFYFSCLVGEHWRTASEYVQKRRKICDPKPAFLTNLIEIYEIFSGSSAEATLLFRCSYHAAYDHNTPVLKLCRNLLNSRRILVPSTSLLNPKGVYILRGVKSNTHTLYLWRGKLTRDSTVEKAIHLAKMMTQVFSKASTIIRIREGEETEDFLSFLLKDGPFAIPNDNSASYEDFYDFPPSHEQIEAADFSTVERRENNYSEVLYSLGMRPNSTIEQAGKDFTSNLRSTNSNRGDETPRSRSSSGERPSYRSAHGDGNRSGRQESEPMSIQLPPPQSRTNSFRGVPSEDGTVTPSINEQVLLDKVNNIIIIISTADVSNNTSLKLNQARDGEVCQSSRPGTSHRISHQQTRKAPNPPSASSKSLQSVGQQQPQSQQNQSQSKPHQPTLNVQHSQPIQSSVPLEPNVPIIQKKKEGSSAPTQLKLPPILGVKDNSQSISNLLVTGQKSSPQGNNYDEFDFTEGIATPPFSRSGSRTKILPSAEVVGVPTTGLTPSRPTSAEKKFVGVSPRVTPLLNKPTTNTGRPSSLPETSLNLSAMQPSSPMPSNRDHMTMSSMRDVPATHRSPTHDQQANSQSSKPALYRLVKRKTEGSFNPLNAKFYEWEAVGPYVDDDLDDVSPYLFFSASFLSPLLF